MKRNLLIISILTIFLSCNKTENLDGIWFHAYEYHEEFNNGHRDHHKIIYVISGETVTEYDFENFKRGETAGYYTEELRLSKNLFRNLLKKGDYNYTITQFEDSLILSPRIEKKYKIILRRPETFLKNKDLDLSFLKGSFRITNNKNEIVDSLDFINDSVFIFTGEYSIDNPEEKWEVINFKGYMLFHNYTGFFPLSIIEFCSNDSIVLRTAYEKDFRITMKPTKSQFNKEDIIGRWIQSEYAGDKQPLENEADTIFRYMQLDISTDSIKVEWFNKYETWKWELTGDGKRIYFADRLFEEEDNSEIRSSIKVLDLEKNNMTILTRHNILDPEFIKLKRISY